LKINRIELTGRWSFKIPVIVLCAYFLVIFPCTQLFFRINPWLYKYSDDMFLAVVVVLLPTVFNIKLSALGFSTHYLKQNLVIGVAAGAGVLLCLPLLETGLSITGLEEHELLAGKVKDNYLFDISTLPEKSVEIFLIPLIEQIFYTGFLLQSLLKKYNPIPSIYAVGLIYTIIGVKLSLGSFGLNIGTSLLFKITGSLYASILFHMGCALGGALVENVYPRLTTLLMFLW